MKHISLLLITLLASVTTLSAKHVPEKVMYYYCTQVASAQYNVPLQHIDAQMPLYKRKGFVVHGIIRHANGYREKFSCRYDAYGKFEFIKKHISQRRTSQIAKDACMIKASSYWNVPLSYISLERSKYLGRGRYMIEVSSDDYIARCEARNNGIIEHFSTRHITNRW